MYGLSTNFCCCSIIKTPPIFDRYIVPNIDGIIYFFSALFSDREIISLFGNVLDNALEACERIQDKKRWIKIKIKKKNHLLYIETSNAIKEMPVQNQKEFVSVKEDEILHGYGMKNIQDIVRKYDGIFRYKIYGEYLVCIISIYDIRGAEEE